MNNESYTSHFRSLGIEPGSSWPEVRTAYRRAASEWHPDRHQGTPEKQRIAEEKFKQINRAYEVLAAYYRRHGKLPEQKADNEADGPAWQRRRDQGPTATHTDRRASEETAAVRWVILRRSAAAAVVVVGAAALLGMFLSSGGQPDLPAAGRHANSADVRANAGGKMPLFDDAAPAVTRQPRQAGRSLSYGAGITEVQDILGLPTRVADNIWYYGDSEIHFKDGVVVDWRISESDPLNVTLDRKALVPAEKNNFAIGDSKSDVLRIQGPPLWKTDSVWQYKVSRVFFDGNKVSGWYDSPLDPLKVRGHH